ncbi:MAG TPA: hypothetical protein PKC22_09725 [Rhodocyclaceae bacterium]|nr:hypothetical protein [Rhodocyclaceae bacterium]
MADMLGSDADMEQLFIDSTIVRAHQHSAGAQKSRRSGNRALAWRTDNQTARRGRCIGQSAARDPLGRTDRRYRLCLGTDRESAGAGRGGRLDPLGVVLRHRSPAQRVVLLLLALVDETGTMQIAGRLADGL